MTHTRLTPPAFADATAAPLVQKAPRATAPATSATATTSMAQPSPIALRQQGFVSRRALLGLVGLGAAAAGAWLALRRTAPTESGSAAGASKSAGSGPSAANAPITDAASAPFIQGDTLAAAFWAQQFDTPAGPALALSAFKGKPLLINFWATWCPPCVKELPELDRFAKEFATQGWQTLGLAIDGPTPVREFLAKVKVGLPIGLAGFGGTELAAALGNEAGGLPFSVMIDAQGRVLHRKMGATTFDELAAWARAAATH
jgi:thiol-disulfide isomerase/thioredoxin